MIKSTQSIILGGTGSNGASGYSNSERVLPPEIENDIQFMRNDVVNKASYKPITL